MPHSYFIEREILRAQCWYNFLNIIISILHKNFNLDLHPIFNKYKNAHIHETRKLIVRWLFILVMSRIDSDDPIFITQKSDDFQHQVKIDIFNFFKDHNPNNVPLDSFVHNLIHNVIYPSFSDYSDIIKNTKINHDNSVIIKHIHKDNNSKRHERSSSDKYSQVILIYNSNNISGNNMFDPYVSILNNQIKLFYYSNLIYLNPDSYNINIVFADYFRYKYLHADNQTLAFKYSGNKNSAIECFSTPFNRYFDHFMSAFYDLEHSLGSLGDFFSTIQKVIDNKLTLPVNDLKINPIFDEIVDQRMAELSISLLNTPHKFTMSFILPNWNDFKAKDILLNSKFFKKKEIFKKFDLYFHNYFTGKDIPPCDIIILYLNNL